MKYKPQIEQSVEKMQQLSNSIILGIEMKNIQIDDILQKVKYAKILLNDIEDKLTLEHNVFEK